MGILKIEYGLKDGRRIYLPSRVVETYFFVIFKNQARQNITKSVLEDNLVHSGIWHIKLSYIFQPSPGFTAYYACREKR